MASVHFTHSYAGSLQIDTGIDSAQWAYGLNTLTIPTYGGEVVQILSVYIDDLTLQGTVTTYAQLEAIYAYFAAYMIAATQGNNPAPQPGTSAYNLDPMYFHYAERNWTFKIYPIEAPGFSYDRDLAAPIWQLKTHVIDDSPDLSIIKEGIKGAAIANLNSIVHQAGALPSDAKFQNLNALSIGGEISPIYGNPNTDPFQTFDQNAATAQQDIKKYADYYNSLIPAYMKSDFSAITGVVGSQPNFGVTQTQTNQATVKVPVPKKK